jgi:transcriptional regulator EpsA
MLAASRLIGRHVELLAWLNEAQDFLPHQVLIAAWGDFQRGNVKTEVISQLAGLRAAQWRGCTLDDVLCAAHGQWIRGGREPLVLDARTAAALRKPCRCALHAALHGLQPLVVHGVRDKLSNCDSLYIVLDACGALPPGGRGRFVALAHLLLCQFDIVWRRLAASRLDCLPAADVMRLPCDLSARECEILASVSRGSTNHDIAEALDISLFTVKNHLKRIFRKIGASNRTQAAARYNQALAQSAHNANR